MGGGWVLAGGAGCVKVARVDQGGVGRGGAG